ncbi:MAG: NAD(P)/FAD-dependent oxidoreductase [Cellulosilyticaceae bacterium]
MDLHYVQGTPIFTKINPMIRQYPYLTQNLETQVVIVGGGVTGAICAYYFAKAKIPCVLLEQARVAHGSTSITTSLLQYELDGNARELEQYMPLEDVKTAYHLGLKALDELKGFIKAYGNRCEYEVRDTLLYTSQSAEASIMEEEYKVRKAAGLPVSYVSEGDLRFSFDLKGGVYGHQGGAQLDPYQYTQHLLEVATGMGARVYENSRVLAIHHSEQGVEVETEYGYCVKADKVVIATGYNTDRFTPRQFGTKTVTYNIATAPVEPFEGWDQKVLIRDNADPYHYFRMTQDGRILAGGEDIPFNPGIFDEGAALQCYDRLLDRVKAMFPAIPELQIDYAYCGAFATTQDNLGFVGPDPKHPHQWYCLGYGANGILFAILGGMMLSSLYLGEEDPDMRLFRVERFDG